VAPHSVGEPVEPDGAGGVELAADGLTAARWKMAVVEADGTHARLRAQEFLADVLDILDNVGDRADRLLDELAALLDGL